MTDADDSLDRMDGAIQDLRGVVKDLEKGNRRWRALAAIAITAAVLSLLAVGAVALHVHHSAGARADLRCAETIDRTEAISDAIQGAVDDVMDAVADQVAGEPGTAKALAVVRERVDRRLAVRLRQIPKC